MPLPPDFSTKLKPLILPYVQEQSQRQALLTDAFYLRDPRVRGRIELEGTPETFVLNCIADLLDFGCLALTGERLHSLAALLLTVREQSGIDQQGEIDEWLPILNDEYATPSPAQPSPFVTAPPQTIDTPAADRLPTVFISYVPADETLARQLIADLGSAGHVCWIDLVALKGGGQWTKSITEGINNSYAFITLLSPEANQSTWVKRAYLWADQKKKLIIPAWARECSVPNDIIEQQVFALHRDYAGELQKLLAKLPAPPAVTPSAAVMQTVEARQEQRKISRRERELAYVEGLRFEAFNLDFFELTEYTALGGIVQERQHADVDEWDALVTGQEMKPEFALIRDTGVQEGLKRNTPAEPFTDAVSKITDLRRVVVLGEPGSGKTHTLRTLAKPLYSAALVNPAAPIPLLVKLGNWDQPEQPFEAFLRASLGDLGADLEDLLNDNHAVLLFDGLNEFPSNQRTTKTPQVERFVKAYPAAMAVVTCREADYSVDLDLHRVMIRPLDPLSIRAVARRALRDDAQGDRFFWALLDENPRRFEARFKMLFANRLKDWETVFWVADNLPDELTWEDEWQNRFSYSWKSWRSLRDHRSGILTLARNPYLLRMLLDVSSHFTGTLPSNRGQLFDQFVNVLLAREKLAQIDPETRQVTLTDEGRALLAGLQQIADEMQVRRSEGGHLSVGTTLPLDSVRAILNERLLDLAVSANLLSLSDAARLSHKLLQEYFSAVFLRERIFVDGGSAHPSDDGIPTTPALRAADIWKRENWWERTNWEEAVILLAGLYSDNCTPVLAWLANANPEMAALCIAGSGAHTPDTTRIQLRDRWLPRLTDLERDPQPQARAAVGRALGRFSIDGQPADNRKGVGLRDDGLPDIDWVEIPTGEFTYQADQRLTLPTFSISRVPVTYGQFQAFVDDPRGFSDPRWWDGLADHEYRREYWSVPGDQAFKFSNHPREHVGWYGAIVFCRWFSWRLGEGYDLDKVGEWAVRLPTVYEWEKAARGKEGLIYPYGNEFDAAKGNTHSTGIDQPSAVGIFPNGASPYGVLDMSGNVWQWCLSDHSDPALNAVDENLRTNNPRGLRGGSWHNKRSFASAIYRDLSYPNVRNYNYGFRLVSAVARL
ncbi:MAG: SUMF1/EgtB/PvdO family nonheme iron enzyme [Chloroflexota bacterium]